ncbi:hypothetical protein K438DRAFT_1981401 [Mycena galopus ATCC 62051]|nr:hypothetical protein K438DRAFT_1981401 [Mycena galopus ATCC 62051]
MSAHVAYRRASTAGADTVDALKVLSRRQILCMTQSPIKELKYANEKRETGGRIVVPPVEAAPHAKGVIVSCHRAA